MSRPQTSSRLDLTLLGIGGAFDADRGVANTGALLEVREGERVTHRYLIDCGHTCGAQLHKLGVTWSDIDAVLLTHAHGDHMDGLELFGFKAHFLCGRRASVITTSDVMDFAWASLSPKMHRIKTGEHCSEQASMLTFFEPIMADDAPVELADGRLRVRFFPVPHIPDVPACGMSIQLPNGASVGWSGDTTFDEESPLLTAKGTREDLIFHECMLFPKQGLTVHTHLEELEKLSPELRERIVLVHHGTEEDQPERRAGMVLGQPFQRFSFPIVG